MEAHLARDESFSRHLANPSETASSITPGIEDCLLPIRIVRIAPTGDACVDTLTGQTMVGEARTVYLPEIGPPGLYHPSRPRMTSFEADLLSSIEWHTSGE